MATIVAVDDPGDQRVGDFVLLTDPDLRRRREQSGGADGGFFIAEGELVIRQLLRSRYRVRSLLLTPRRLASLEAELHSLDVPVFVAGQEVVDAISGFHLHRGALAAAERGVPADARAVAEPAELLVVAEGVNDHENLGALFRNAAAFGAGGLLLDPTSADPLYRRSVRVSMGHVLRVPFARLGGWPDSLSHLRAAGFELLALTPATDAVDLRQVRPRPRQALVVGAEGPGLSAAVLAAADVRVRITMAPGVDSLNVATAAAVALHHLAGAR
ncbi:MAG: RNA methyltransferase [Actinobacteria bacterium]|nr:RNA methyltransferase [Actinomycetota bacterium]